MVVTNLYQMHGLQQADDDDDDDAYYCPLQVFIKY